MTKQETQRRAEEAMIEKRERHRHSTNPDRMQVWYPRTEYSPKDTSRSGRVGELLEMVKRRNNPRYGAQESLREALYAEIEKKLGGSTEDHILKGIRQRVGEKYIAELSKIAKDVNKILTSGEGVEWYCADFMQSFPDSVIEELLKYQSK